MRGLTNSMGRTLATAQCGHPTVHQTSRDQHHHQHRSRQATTTRPSHLQLAIYVLAAVVGGGMVELAHRTGALRARARIAPSMTASHGHEHLLETVGVTPTPPKTAGRSPHCPRHLPDGAPELGWGCSCQGLSEVHGLDHLDSGSRLAAPLAAQQWWKERGCTTRPTALRAPGQAQASGGTREARRASIRRGNAGTRADDNRIPLSDATIVRVSKGVHVPTTTSASATTHTPPLTSPPTSPSATVVPSLPLRPEIARCAHHNLTRAAAGRDKAGHGPEHFDVQNFVDVCSYRARPRHARRCPPPTLRYASGCHLLGLGNSMSMMWMARLTAAAAGLELELSPCPKESPLASRANAWYTVLGAGPSIAPIPPVSLTAAAICSGPCASNAAYPHECDASGLEHMVPVIEHDLRLVADRHVAAQPDEESRLDFAVDDVAIHLRVGDLFSPRNDMMGLAPWWFIQQSLLGIEPSSIGVVTIAGSAPRSQRYLDRTYADMGSAVLADLVRFLETTYPNTTVRVHNGPRENPVASISRLVLAPRRTVCSGISTFCLWAGMASRGVGYIPYNQRMYPWGRKVAGNAALFFDPPLLSGKEAEGWNSSRISAWLRQAPPPTPLLRQNRIHIT